MPDNQFPTLPQLFRRPTVEQATGLSRSTIYRMIAAGQFPKPVQLGAKAVAWRAEDVAAFINNLTNTEA